MTDFALEHLCAVSTKRFKFVLLLFKLYLPLLIFIFFYFKLLWLSFSVRSKVSREPCKLINAVKNTLIRCFTVYMTVTKGSASSCRIWQLALKMTVVRLSPALAPCAAQPPVILCTWNVLASLQMASVNAADRGITISHNFLLSAADALCQTLKWTIIICHFFLRLPETWMQTKLFKDQEPSQESDCHTSLVSFDLSDPEMC